MKEFNVVNFPFLRQLATEGLLSNCIQFLLLHRVTRHSPILSSTSYKVNVSRQTGPHCSGMFLKVF